MVPPPPGPIEYGREVIVAFECADIEFLLGLAAAEELAKLLDEVGDLTESTALRVRDSRWK